MIEQNVRPFKLEFTTQKLTPHAGLALAHEFHLGLGLDRLLDEHLPPPGSNRGYDRKRLAARPTPLHSVT